jgi:hypothetical protein
MCILTARLGERCNKQFAVSDLRAEVRARHGKLSTGPAYTWGYLWFRRHDSKNSILAGTWLGRAGGGGGLLAFELDATGCADGLSVFSALAWVRFGGRCRGLDARG